MVCKVCGTENAYDAILCKHCGKRLDGKQICKSCGTENDEDALYCKKCGKSLAAEVGGKVAPSGEVTLRSSSGSPLWRKIVEISGWTFAMFGVFFSLLFTFLIGIGAKVNATDTSSANISGEFNHNLYYYFSDVYKDVKQHSVGTTDAVRVTLYLPAVIGTIVSASVIIAVCITAAVAVYKFVVYARGKSNADFAKATIATYVEFLLGSLVLLCLEHFSTESRASGISLKMNVVLNTATLAGIILGAVCLFIFAACRVASRGKAILQGQYITRAILSVVACALLTVVLAFVPRAVVNHSVDSTYSSYTTALPIMDALQLYVLSYKTNVAGEMIVAIIAQIVQIALIVVAAIALLCQIRNLCEEKRNNSLIVSIPMLLLAIAYMALCIVFVNMAMDASLEKDITCPAAIVSMVLAAVYFVLTVVQTIFKGKQQTQLHE